MATRAESYKNITRFNSFVHKTELFAKSTSETAPSLFVKQSRLTKQTLLDGSCSQWIQNDPGSYLACTCRQGVVLILLRASITRRLNCYQSMPYLTQFGPRLQSHLCCLQCNLCYQLIELKDSVHLERSNTVPGNSSLSRSKNYQRKTNNDLPSVGIQTHDQYQQKSRSTKRHRSPHAWKILSNKQFCEQIFLR